MLRAEFVKMKRTTLFWMHILVPIVGTGIVLWYYKRLGALDMNVKSIGEFLEILSLAFPTLSGIVCALGTEMEVDAGNMQVLLGGVAGKCRAGGVKLVALLLLGAMGTLLALGSYLVGIDRKYDNKQRGSSSTVRKAGRRDDRQRGRTDKCGTEAKAGSHQKSSGIASTRPDRWDRSKSGLIGKNTAGNTHFHRHLHTISSNSASNCTQPKCFSENP